MTLSPDQKQIIDTFVTFMNDANNAEMLITGSPGTGKTYLIKYLIEYFKNNKSLFTILKPKRDNIYCTATTNKAASALSSINETCDFIDVTTIHSLLKLKIINNYNTGEVEIKKVKTSRNLIQCLLIIDEYSYIDVELLKIIRNSTYKCKIIYVGDEYQVTPVNGKQNNIKNEVYYKSTLTYSHRFNINSNIAKLAVQLKQAITTGVFKPITFDNVEIINVDKSGFYKSIVQQFCNSTNTLNKNKILAWSNEKVIEYNSYIRNTTTNNKEYNVGEYLITNKIIKTANNKIIYKIEDVVQIKQVIAATRYTIEGNIYTLKDNITVFQANNQREVKQLLVKMANTSKKNNNWKQYFILKEFFADLRSIYACTVHKSQGSTYETVFIDLNDIKKCKDINVLARMIYVAITRASNKIIIYGSIPLYNYSNDYF